jgi:hypothetical protein
MSPPPLGYDNPKHAEEYALLRRSQRALSIAAFALLITIGILAVSLAAIKTQPATCAYGVSRFFVVKTADESDTKQVGGFKRALRAVQSSLGVTDEEDRSWWWAVRAAHRRVLDTSSGHLRAQGILLVDEPGSNTSRLILRGRDACSDTLENQLEPSINVDEDSFSVRHRDWKVCADSGAADSSAKADEATWDFTTVRVNSHKQLRFATTADIGRLFPAVRADLPNKATGLHTVADGYIYALAVYNGQVVAQIQTISDTPTNPLHDDSSVRSIFVTFDSPARDHTRELDFAMRRASHRAQDLLGKGVAGTGSLRGYELALLVR